MIRHSRFFLLVSLSLTGCAALAPTETIPVTGAPVETSVAVCYSRLASNQAQVEAAAAQECTPGTTPKLRRSDWTLDACPILTPVRATFDCQPR